MLMKRDSLVSVIIPAYNAELYIETCMDSLCQQSYWNMQIILIDDGSTDRTLSICKRLQAADPRIEVYHQNNAGPAAARNTGLEHVTGDYLMFVDADDVLASDAVQVLVERMELSRADMCGFGWYDIQNGEKASCHCYSEDERGAQKNQIINNVLLDDFLNGGGFLWNKIWRASTIKQDAFQQFDVSLWKYEDKLWVLQNIVRCNRFLFLNEMFYYYRLLPHSLSHGESTLQSTRAFYHAANQISAFLNKQYPEMRRTARRWSQSYLASMLFRAIKEKAVTSDDVQEAKRYRLWQMPFGTKAKLHWLIAKVILLLGKRVI